MDVVSVTGLSHTSLMERSASKEIGRGLLVTFAASLSGPMLGVITFGLNRPHPVVPVVIAVSIADTHSAATMRQD